MLQRFWFIWFFFLSEIYTSLTIPPIYIEKVLFLEDVTLLPHSAHVSKRSIDSYSSFDLIFTLPHHYQRTECPNSMKKYVKLVLEPNLDLLNDDSTLQIYNELGEIVHSERIDKKDYRVYRGTVFITYVENDVLLLKKKWYEIGSTRILLHQDGDQPIFEGSFSLSGEVYTVTTLEKYMLLKEQHDPDIYGSNERMVIWRESDYSTKTLEKRNKVYRSSICEYAQLADNEELLGSNFTSLLSKHSTDVIKHGDTTRENLLKTIGDISGCPKYKRNAFVGAVLDCNYISNFESKKAAISHIVLLYNKVSEIYERTFNISFSLANLTVMDKSCSYKSNSNTLWNRPCLRSYYLLDRLKHFSLWTTRHRSRFAFWSLFTTCRSTTDVGIAWLGVLCKDSLLKIANVELNSGANVIASPMVVEDIVLSHEIAHSFGAHHDCAKETCSNPSITCCPLNSMVCDANDNFIMSPKSSVTLRTFSLCTIGQICNNLAKKVINSDCLSGNKEIISSSNICGNGIVEKGEDCDCGGLQGCKGNPCCDPITCKFTPGSVCDDSNDLCCRQCKFAPKGTVCRPSNDICDIAEVCSGVSSTCPQNVVKNNGMPCGKGLRCASGICTSRNKQCKKYFNNSKGACHSSCVLLCKVRDSCLYSGLQNYFIDGTPCGINGLCYQGFCKEKTFSSQLKAYFSTYNIWILILFLLLLFLLAFILYYIYKRYYSKKPQKNIFSNEMSNLPYRNYPTYYNPNNPHS